MNKILVLVFVIFILAKNVFCQTVDRNCFSTSEIEYIYNRVLDVAIKNNGNGNSVYSLFQVFDSDFYSDVHFIINKDVSTRYFWPFYAFPKDSITFEQVTSFDTINTIRFNVVDSICFSDLSTVEKSNDCNIILISFSNIYFFKNRYYLGISVWYKKRESKIHKIGNHIVEFEYCINKYILFRKLILYYGKNLSGLGIHNFNIDDVDCN